ncbi:hypothetical protein [Herpetosiphon sp. NSE202]|uniref:hypothetical protein n=1 Tax=Herpetosiphon sp. NSE202 TaxID=3351349 RepID=UPI00363BD0DA
MKPMTSKKSIGLLGILVVSLFASMLTAKTPPVQAAPNAVGWGTAQVVAAGALKNLHSDVAIDSNGKTHITWIRLAASTSDASEVMYTNNVNGTWLTPYVVSNSAGHGADPFVSMAVEGNRAHIIFISFSGIAVHRYLTFSGSSVVPSVATNLSSTKSSTPEIITDKTGRIHAFWGDRRAGATAQIVHRIWANGSWESNTGRVVRNDGSNQKYPRATATADGQIHMTFLGENKFPYQIFNGTTWISAGNLDTGKTKIAALTSKGNTVIAVYTLAPSTHIVYYKQGNNGNWSNRVQLSSGASYDEFPAVTYNEQTDRVYTTWLSGPGDTAQALVAQEINPGISFAPVQKIDSALVGRAWPQIETRGSRVTIVWHHRTVSSQPFNVYRIEGNTGGDDQITPTPSITPTPTQPPVGFTLARSSASPSTNPNVTLAISNMIGNPDQMRVSTTAFTAQSAGPNWEGLNTSKVVNTGAGVNSCLTAVYVQLRNSSNGQVSNVQSVSAVIDTGIQSVPQIYTMETAPSARPANLTEAQVQPFAPDRVSEKYTRNMTFAYTIAQETGGCSGIARHKAGPFAVNNSSYPYSGFSAFDSFVTGNDSNGTGFEEQTVNATVILTDTLGIQSVVSKQFTYDDDAPVLSAGGSISLPNGATTNVSVIPLNFTASVTDDGYMNSAPADKRYWGVWAVATTSTTLPSPQDFLQYGDVIGLEDGATSVDYVRLVNALTGTQAGTRYVHLRFLDGAGNYTSSGLTSEPITLQANYTGLPNYLPWVTKAQ